MVRSARIGREVPMRYLGAVLMLVSLGCGDAKVPVEPSPPSVAPALQEFRLSGAVSDTANRPLAGSKVEVMDGSRTGTVGTTDEAGRFSMPGTFTGNITLTASKDGYVRETRPVVPSGLPLPQGNAGGGWELAFHLEPIGPSANVAGMYTATLTADSMCTNLPAEARSRSYTATIASSGRSSSYVARLSDARFFSTVPCPPGRPAETCTYNQFGIGIAGDFANIGSGGIVEQLADTTYLVFTGGGGASFDPSGITLPLDGSFQYCPNEPAWTSGEYWECEGGVQCDSHHHQLRLVRR
jgi:hypothetical protein